jgi:nucleotide-binding universal stress UspA family protein
MDSPPPSPYAHIACCVDDSSASASALEEARRLRACGPGRLSLVHAAPRGLIYEADEEGRWIVAERDLQSVERRWLEDLARGVPEAEPVLLEGFPPEAVCGWAREAGVDLLVTATHRGLAERVLFGSFSAHLARHAPCPVLLVRPEPPRETRSG